MISPTADKHYEFSCQNLAAKLYKLKLFLEDAKIGRSGLTVYLPWTWRFYEDTSTIVKMPHKKLYVNSGERISYTVYYQIND